MLKLFAQGLTFLAGWGLFLVCFYLDIAVIFCGTDISEKTWQLQLLITRIAHTRFT